MKTRKKETPIPADPAADAKPEKDTRDMTIEEAREAEKAFNEELRIFREAAKLNRNR